MSEIVTPAGALHAEVDGEGEPVTILAHGLTNNCHELAALTPMVPGTKVRFCFRGHGHSRTEPDATFRFADFADDLDAVAKAYGATRAIGTSLGAGAVTTLLGRDPARFERMVFLLPAGLDEPFMHKERFRRTAEMMDGRSAEEALQAVLDDPERAAEYLEMPWRIELDKTMWEHRDPDALSRAIRQVIEDFPVPDRQVLRSVAAPILLICLEGDPIHPIELGRILADLMPNAELLTFADQDALFAAIPMLIAKVSSFLAGNG